MICINSTIFWLLEESRDSGETAPYFQAKVDSPNGNSDFARELRFLHAFEKSKRWRETARNLGWILTLIVFSQLGWAIRYAVCDALPADLPSWIQATTVLSAVLSPDPRAS